ncbi:MAG: VWA domain-containing protein [Thiohalocapsa sp. PB-PSB1]|jgi:serine/threonine-protein kinase PpkA|nr:MAG: hypothetical protein N838_08845 [Thiohalocapsa sp. PB-PSB1]QQO55912.1 MAG: VWA domain-containing protein [Thiohalocapsa sp. PB-PSB1]HCS91559.1 VWA domain-containing protein [Chromatiaceae bacterium]
MTKMRTAIACVALLLLGIAAGQAAQRAPLLQDGKQTLHRRVLTRPGAELVAQPGMAGGTPIDAFTRYYVYAQREQSAKQWLEVGVDTKGKTLGWVEAASTVPWRQQLVVAFTNPGAERERALFFDSWDSLEALMARDDPASELEPLTQRIASGGNDPRVLAIEPDRYIDINQNFYLLPILDSREYFTDAGHLLRGLQVASITKTEMPATPVPATPSAEAGEVRKLAPFRAAVVFVIDSTISMQRYIDEAREAVRKVYQEVVRSGLLDRVSFGLVAFRARSENPQRNRQLEYVEQVFVDPSQVASPEEFLAKAAALSEARTTTDHFDEDPYAGIQAALEQIAWERFGARFLVLITDAGALEGDASTTGLGAEQVRSLAAEEQVNLLVLHLKTPQGADNHASAEVKYRTLAQNPAIQDSTYIPVNTGSVPAYRNAVRALAETVTRTIERSARGELGPAPSASDAGADPAARVRELVERLGYAMQLVYLGRMERTAAPQVFEAWISDRDLAQPTVRAVDARVLLTKDQLSTLHGILKQVLDAAEAGLLQPDAFFDNLRSLATRYTRDPNLAERADARSLADLGLLEEYLQGLPYQSEVMRVDLDTWSRWGVQKQQAFIARIKSKLQLYELYNADADRWVSLAAGSPVGEQVYPVPLRDLP